MNRTTTYEDEGGFRVMVIRVLIEGNPYESRMKYPMAEEGTEHIEKRKTVMRERCDEFLRKHAPKAVA